MKLVKPGSLADTVDAVNDVLFWKETIKKKERAEVARFIAGRAGSDGSYEGMPAPTKKDFNGGITLYTGEKVTTRAGIAHTLGQEACRVLRLLDVNTQRVRDVLEKADARMRMRIKAGGKCLPDSGMYCCAICSCALWRHIEAGGMHWCKGMVLRGVRTLKSRRDGKGKWRGYPFYYTLLALNDIVFDRAWAEIYYARDACIAAAKRMSGKDKISRRRRELIRRVWQRI